MMKRTFLIVFAALVTSGAPAQHFFSLGENRQHHFSRTVPPGNYSGIAWLGGDRYAVADDKSATDGFRIFRIEIDSLSGDIRNVEDEGFMSSAAPNRDQEGIAFVPSTGTLFVCGEADGRILEYSMDGRHTGRSIVLPDCFGRVAAGYGLESLTYNAVTGRFWTTSESTLPADGPAATAGSTVRNRLRLQSFGADLRPADWYWYEMDAPTARRKAARYAFGVSELCALDDGRLIVLEREFFVPRRKIGAYVNVSLYAVDPSSARPGERLDKVLLCSFRTRLSLFGRSLANYEGMCLGPSLGNGNHVLILVSDSQNQYRGVLKDWFKTFVIRPQ